MNLYGGTITYRTPSGRMGIWTGPATAMSPSEAAAKVLDQLQRHPGRRRIADKIDTKFVLLQENTK